MPHITITLLPVYISQVVAHSAKKVCFNPKDSTKFYYVCAIRYNRRDMFKQNHIFVEDKVKNKNYTMYSIIKFNEINDN